MENLIAGSDTRIRVYANEYSGNTLVGAYNLDNLAQLEYWVYTTENDIKKYHKGTELKSGYAGLMIKDTTTEYHINFLGSVNKLMRQGTINIDVMVSFTDAEITELICLESICTDLYLKFKPISA